MQLTQDMSTPTHAQPRSRSQHAEHSKRSSPHTPSLEPQQGCNNPARGPDIPASTTSPVPTSTHVPCPPHPPQTPAAVDADRLMLPRPAATRCSDPTHQLASAQAPRTTQAVQSAPRIHTAEPARAIAAVKPALEYDDDCIVLSDLSPRSPAPTTGARDTHTATAQDVAQAVSIIDASGPAVEPLQVRPVPHLEGCNITTADLLASDANMPTPCAIPATVDTQQALTLSATARGGCGAVAEAYTAPCTISATDNEATVDEAGQHAAPAPNSALPRQIPPRMRRLQQIGEHPAPSKVCLPHSVVHCVPPSPSWCGCMLPRAAVYIGLVLLSHEQDYLEIAITPLQ
jgi:hypothetical protein